MVTDNQNCNYYRIVAAVLLALVPIGHTMPFVFKLTNKDY